VYSGDGSVIGFIRAMRRALKNGAYDAIHAHQVPVAFLFLLTRLVVGRPLKSTIFTLHTSYPNVRVRDRFMLLVILALFRRIVCCGSSSLESLPRLYRWLAGRRSRVIPNGLNLDRLDDVARCGKSRSSQAAGLRVAVVGRLIEVKNPETALSALTRCTDPDIGMVFIGEGRLRRALTQQARMAGLSDRVEFTGLIPRDHVYRRLLEVDLVISTSLVEGLPVAVLEAMACGRPVVLSNIPAHVEIVRNAPFVPLIHPRNVAGYAQEIMRFRRMPPDERLEIGRKCRTLVETRFSLPSMLAAYEAVYAQVRDEIPANRRA
jgi:glycosyltransferase involved in cell wall biosynthesis